MGEAVGTSAATTSGGQPATAAHRPPPVYEHPPPKLQEPLLRRLRLGTELDNLFFLVANLCVLLLAMVLLKQGLRLSWGLLYLVGFWLILTYLGLPRIHRVLTSIYVPDYFIGRTHTSDGLLGDPVNLATRGNAGQIHDAMQHAGWTLADPITLRSAWRIVVCSLTRRSYPEAPVSPLLLFGRQQAFAYQQEVEGNPAQRHHVRFWPTPDGWLLPGGHRVDFLAAGTYDRSVGLSLFTLQVTHKIDADIDAERDYIVETVQYALPSVETTVLQNFSTGYHSRNGGGDQVRTDGDLPILELAELPEAAAKSTAVTQDHGLTARPPALLAGALMLLLGSVGDLVSYLPQVSSLITDTSQGSQLSREVVIAILISTAGFALLIELVLVVLTMRGHGWARLVLLTILSTQLLVQLIQWVRLPAGSLDARAVLTTTAYALAVYAFSSLTARTWTTRVRRRLQQQNAV